LTADFEALRTERGLPAIAAAVVKYDAIVGSGAAGVRVYGANMPRNVAIAENER
jgi:hypothetical protein